MEDKIEKNPISVIEQIAVEVQNMFLCPEEFLILEDSAKVDFLTGELSSVRWEHIGVAYCIPRKEVDKKLFLNHPQYEDFIIYERQINLPAYTGPVYIVFGRKLKQDNSYWLGVGD